jgi:hypothetical protein
MAGNPESIRWIVALFALYMHVGPFSRDVITRIEDMIAALAPPAIEPCADVELTLSNLAT